MATLKIEWISLQLYNKCKDYNKPIDVPTTILYFDEVRKNKKKKM